MPKSFATAFLGHHAPTATSKMAHIAGGNEPFETTAPSGRFTGAQIVPNMNYRRKPGLRSA